MEPRANMEEAAEVVPTPPRADHHEMVLSCPLPNPLPRGAEPELPTAEPDVEAPQLGLGSGQLGLLHVEVQATSD